MKQALGLVEISGLSAAIVAADAMAKAANIRIVEIENTKGLGYMTIKAIGDVGAVKAAVDVGRQVAAMHNKLVSHKVIPRPSSYVEEYFIDPDDGKKVKPDAGRELVVEHTAADPVPQKTESGGENTVRNTLDQAAGEPEADIKSLQEELEASPPDQATAVESGHTEEDGAESEHAPLPEHTAGSEETTADSAAEALKKTPSKSSRRKGTAKKKESGQNETG